MTDTKAMEFKLQLSSKVENINLVEPFVQKLQSHYKFDEDTYYNILLVLTEAVNNSIIHGNEKDPLKQVVVNTRLRRRMLHCVVKDEGKGFDPCQLPDPTSPDRITCPNGRGVYLMQQLADHLNFSDEGRSVEIHFKVG